MTQKKMHKFSSSVKNGDLGASLAMDYLLKDTKFKEKYNLGPKEGWIQSVEGDKLYQKQGIDFLYHRKEGEPIKIEVKTELYVSPDKPETQHNVFFEIISNDTDGKPGWTYSTKADVVVYYMPYMGLAMFMPFPETAEWLKENEIRFKDRLRSAKNPRYSSWGYAINYKTYAALLSKHLGKPFEYYKFPTYTKESWDAKMVEYMSGDYTPSF